MLASIDGIPVLDLRYVVADYLRKTSKIDEQGSRLVLASATAAVSEMLSRFDFESDNQDFESDNSRNINLVIGVQLGFCREFGSVSSVVGLETISGTLPLRRAHHVPTSFLSFTMPPGLSIDRVVSRTTERKIGVGEPLSPACSRHVGVQFADARLPTLMRAPAQHGQALSELPQSRSPAALPRPSTAAYPNLSGYGRSHCFDQPLRALVDEFMERSGNRPAGHHR